MTQSREVLKLREAPLVVQAGHKLLRRVNHLWGHTEGYTLEPSVGGGFVVRIKHKHSGSVSIQLGSTGVVTSSTRVTTEC